MHAVIWFKWNLMENCLINVIDGIAPLVEVELGKRYSNKIVQNNEIQGKIILRKKLLWRDRLLGTCLNNGHIKIITPNRNH